MKASRILFIATVPLALLGALFLLFAFGTAFDPSVSHYFTAGSPFPVLSGVFLALSVGCGIAGAILAKKNPEGLSSPAVPSYATAPAAFGALCSAVWLLVAGQVMLGVLVLFASIFFTLCACFLAKLYGKYLLWAGFIAIAAAIALNVTYYFDMALEMNAPVKVLLQSAVLAVMLYVTAECRLLLGRFDRLLIPILTVLCISLCIGAGAVDLYLLFAKKESAAVYLAAAPLLLGVGLTALWRLAQMLLSKKVSVSTADRPIENEEDKA